jgi:hypothetical protein
MLIKKADVKNHLAAKLRKRHGLQGSTIGQIPAEHSSGDATLSLRAVCDRRRASSAVDACGPEKQAIRYQPSILPAGTHAGGFVQMPCGD